MSWRGPALMLILVSTLYIAARPWLIDTVGGPNLALGIVAASVVLSLAVAGWQARTRRYACPACAHEFGVTLVRNLVSQNWFGRLHTQCPACGEKAWCDVAPDGQD
ncbi:MAG TPA: hypothetical protein QGF95_06320 [Candidatus Latescibacteria bacterium]|nr:hypothetical protein [Gemmatimonadaceae bacterium]HJP30151.1 hypothetical protein [Candidatus Latescibacterota bacterium]